MIKRKHVSILSASLLSAALFGVLSVAPASASTGNSDDAVVSGQTCVVQVETGAENCYAPGVDWAKATSDLTGTPVIVADSAADYKVQYTALAQKTRSIQPLAVTLVIGTIYDDINYGGGSKIFTGSANSASNCGGTTFTIHDLSTLGWANRASAMKPSSGCNMTIWENVGNTGAQIGGSSNIPWLGALSDKGKSLSWKP